MTLGYVKLTVKSNLERSRNFQVKVRIEEATRRLVVESSYDSGVKDKMLAVAH